VGLMAESEPQALELQRQLYEIAGPPDPEALGREFTKNLDEARSRLAYAECVESDDLERARQNLAWRLELMDELA
jgi:hypothetical protein